MSYTNPDTAKLLQSKNYIPAPRLANGTTGGWSLFTTTLTGVIPTGSISAGAASIGTFQTVTGANAIEGFVSLNTAANALVTGQGFISDTFTIDVEDQAKVMQGSFYYRVNSGASNAVFSGTSTNTFAIYIYDVTNSAWIQPAGVYSINQSSGVGMASFTFQTTSNSTQYRLAVLAVNNVIGAVNLTWDDFYIGPQKVVYGAPITDWQSYTLTVSGLGAGSSTNLAYWRRVGDSVEIYVRVTKDGTPGSGVADVTFSLPSGLVVDENKVPATATQATVVGPAASFNIEGSVIWETSATAYQRGTTTSVKLLNVGSGSFYTGADFLASSIAIFRATLPISGWSSTVQMSNDTDTRVVAAQAYRSTTQTGINPNNSIIKIALNSVTPTGSINHLGFDTHAAFNTTNNQYVVPVPGQYLVTGVVELAGTNVLNNRYQATLGINGTVGSAYGPTQVPAAGALTTLTVTGLFTLPAGATIELGLYGAGNNSVSTLTANAGANGTYMTVQRLSGPSAIAASETVAVGLRKTGNQTYTANNTSQNLTFVTTASKIAFDTHGSWNGTDTFTAPVAGKYRISAHISTNSTNVAVADYYLLATVATSTTVSLGFVRTTAINTPIDLGGAITANLNAGDTVVFKFSTTANHSVNNLTINTDTYAFIERIGN